jgi:hypothetical protein
MERCFAWTFLTVLWCCYARPSPAETDCLDWTRVPSALRKESGSLGLRGYGPKAGKLLHEAGSGAGSNERECLLCCGSEAEEEERQSFHVFTDSGARYDDSKRAA